MAGDWIQPRAQPMGWRIACAAGVAQPYWTRFDVGLFDAGAFARAEIDCPPQIRASVGKRQAEFFYGRLCAREALAALGAASGAIGIGAGREPLWPAGTTGSITHTATLAAAVALPTPACAGIGLDIEMLQLAEGAVTALRETVVSRVELGRLARWEPLLGRSVPVVMVFSAKESFFKGIYGEVRRYVEFDALEFEAIEFDGPGREGGRMRFWLRETLSPHWLADRLCHVHFRLFHGSHVATMFIREPEKA